MGRKRKSHDRICPICNTTFYKPLSFVLKYGAQTCSRKCAAVLRVKAQEKTCEHCGKPFQARRSQLKKGFGKYCSKACNGAATITRVEIPCRWCETPVLVAPHQRITRKSRRTAKHFCSNDCRIAWMKRFGTKKGIDTFCSHIRKEWIDSKCARCGSTEDLELDHIVPRFAGGKPTKENSQTLCRSCNRNKYWNEDRFLYDPDQSRA